MLSVTRLGDVNTALSSNSEPTEIVAMGATLYFAHASNTNGAEVFKSDGTAGGTTVLKDIGPGSAGSAPDMLTVVGSKLFFTAEDDATGRELWVSDGTAAGTTRVKDIWSGTEGSAPFGLTAGPGGLLFFWADDGVHGCELWRSDGTGAGTFLVADAVPGAVGQDPFTVVRQQTTVFGSSLFFTASTSEDQMLDGLFAVTGTAGSLRTVYVPASSESSRAASELCTIGSKLYFTDNSALYASDGTTAGTAAIAGATSVTALLPDAGNGRLYIAKATGMLRLDAGSVTPAVVTTTTRWAQLMAVGSTRVLASAAGSYTYIGLLDAAGTTVTSFFLSQTIMANEWAVLGSSLYLLGTKGLIKTDGTSAGTSSVVSSTTLPVGIPRALVSMNSMLYFAFNQATTGTEVWKSDGTAAGTSELVDLYRGTESSSPVPLGTIGNTLIFGATDSATTTGLYKTSGVAGDITFIAGSAGAPSSVDSIGSKLVFGSKLFYVNASGKPYTTDGTTVALLTGSSSSNFVAWNGNIWYVASVSTSPTSSTQILFRVESTGSITQVVTLASTWAITSIAVGPNNKLYMAGAELYVSDGTTAGTALLKEINPTVISTVAQGAYPYELTYLNGLLYMAADDGVHGVEPWVTDGTTAGTRLLADLVSDTSDVSGSSDPQSFVALGGRVYFRGYMPNYSYNLYVTDGTSAGTVPMGEPASGPIRNILYRIVSDGSRLFFVGDDATLGYALFVSRGTSESTTLVKDIEPRTDVEIGSGVTLMDGRVFFSAFTYANGTELWTSDGTSAGTYRLTDVTPGSTDGVPTNSAIAPFKGGVLIGGDDGSYGVEPWLVSDTFAPIVVDASLDVATAQKVTLQFGENVASTFTASDIVVKNSSGNTISSSLYTVAILTAPNGATRATITFSPVLADGRYSVNLASSAVADVAGNSNAAYSFSFSVLAGDANRDGVVNFSDLLVLASHYGATGQNFTTGDFNYDGTVNFSDLLMLASRYGKSAAGTVGVSRAASKDKAATRLATDVLA
ncbi:MAG: dockerin type I domain-containing protein [Tepidisphaeraceae bacterium]